MWLWKVAAINAIVTLALIPVDINAAIASGSLTFVWCTYALTTLDRQLAYRSWLPNLHKGVIGSLVVFSFVALVVNDSLPLVTWLSVMIVLLALLFLSSLPNPLRLPFGRYPAIERAAESVRRIEAESDDGAQG